MRAVHSSLSFFLLSFTGYASFRSILNTKLRSNARISFFPRYKSFCTDSANRMTLSGLSYSIENIVKTLIDDIAINFL